MKGENAVGVESGPTGGLIGQHGGCGLPMVMTGRKRQKRAWHPDQISSLEARNEVFDPEGYEVEVETWQCPCSCTQTSRDV